MPALVHTLPGHGTRCSHGPSAASSPFPTPGRFSPWPLLVLRWWFSFTHSLLFGRTLGAVSVRGRTRLESRAPDEVMRDGAFSPALVMVR